MDKNTLQSHAFDVQDALNDIPLLESSIELSYGKNVLLYVQDYFIKCLQANPEVRFDGHLSNIGATKIFLYWLTQYRSEKEIGM